ncbi:MAG: hypothetical protein K940chlam6_00210 [Chlamydiae bacterium]|nr:hypothetical protein [Chlamydiota bacterium]NGX46720.1 hypothetical protein [Chlamydiota bacterium]
MKTLDVIVAILLVIGGLNWGLIGFFNFDLIGTVFGYMSAFTRLVYCLVGVSALYQIFQWKAIQQRWKRK